MKYMGARGEEIEQDNETEMKENWGLVLKGYD